MSVSLVEIHWVLNTLYNYTLVLQGHTESFPPPEERTRSENYGQGTETDTQLAGSIFVFE